MSETKLPELSALNSNTGHARCSRKAVHIWDGLVSYATLISRTESHIVGHRVRISNLAIPFKALLTSEHVRTTFAHARLDSCFER